MLKIILIILLTLVVLGFLAEYIGVVLVVGGAILIFWMLSRFFSIEAILSFIVWLIVIVAVVAFFVVLFLTVRKWIRKFKYLVYKKKEQLQEKFSGISTEHIREKINLAREYIAQLNGGEQDNKENDTDYDDNTEEYGYKQMALEKAQMLSEHPVLQEDIEYRKEYLNGLEYFVKKYSANNIFAKETFNLYTKVLMVQEGKYTYEEMELKHQAKNIFRMKFKPFKLYTYRYCFIFDCIFMNGYDNKKKGEHIFRELSSIYPRWDYQRIERIFYYLYDSAFWTDEIENIQYMKACCKANREFQKEPPLKVIVTANMSAGKSTLLNALVGKKVNRTQNDACTAKIHYIVNKPYEDGFCYELDHDLEMDANNKILMEDNEMNDTAEIIVSTFFRTVGTKTKRTWYIDTPGVNSSQNTDHKDLTEETIKSLEVDLLIYLMNGENIGTYDDRKHLLFISQNYHGKILFVVNKLDCFRKEDSVSETLEVVIEDLKEIGFESPCVVPISAYAGYLAKMSIFGENLDEDEQDELNRMFRKSKKEKYQFDTYFPENIQKSIHLENDGDAYQTLIHSGVLQLENLIYNMR